jgi:hypothetical protein
MPMQQVKSTEAITKPEFHKRLRAWFRDTDEVIIGPPNTVGVAAWVYVQDGDARYKLHADVKREAVGQYLGLVDRYGDEIEWTVVENEKGNMNAVAYGPEQVRITPFYLYRI